MANAVQTLTRPSYGVTKLRGHADGGIKVRYRDLTLDTGNYTTGGLTVTAASLGMRQIYFASGSGSVATTGTSGATGSPYGITYATDGSSITLQLYEGAASGAALGEKTNAEAVEANFTIRLRVEGV